MTKEETKREMLIRLKRKAGRERGRYARIHRESTSGYSKERAFGEMNVCAMFMQWLTKEIKKIDGKA